MDISINLPSDVNSMCDQYISTIAALQPTQVRLAVIQKFRQSLTDLERTDLNFGHLECARNHVGFQQSSREPLRDGPGNESNRRYGDTSSGRPQDAHSSRSENRSDSTSGDTPDEQTCRPEEEGKQLNDFIQSILEKKEKIRNFYGEGKLERIVRDALDSDRNSLWSIVDEISKDVSERRTLEVFALVMLQRRLLLSKMTRGKFIEAQGCWKTLEKERYRRLLRTMVLADNINRMEEVAPGTGVIAASSKTHMFQLPKKHIETAAKHLASIIEFQTTLQNTGGLAKLLGEYEEHVTEEGSILGKRLKRVRGEDFTEQDRPRKKTPNQAAESWTNKEVFYRVTNTMFTPQPNQRLLGSSNDGCDRSTQPIRTETTSEREYPNTQSESLGPTLTSAAVCSTAQPQQVVSLDSNISNDRAPMAFECGERIDDLNLTGYEAAYLDSHLDGIDNLNLTGYRGQAAWVGGYSEEINNLSLIGYRGRAAWLGSDAFDLQQDGAQPLHASFSNPVGTIAQPHCWSVNPPQADANVHQHIQASRYKE